VCAADVLKHVYIKSTREAKSVDLHQLLSQDQVSDIQEQWM